jgi:hypothetical protein
MLFHCDLHGRSVLTGFRGLGSRGTYCVGTALCQAKTTEQLDNIVKLYHVQAFRTVLCTSRPVTNTLRTFCCQR